MNMTRRKHLLEVANQLGKLKETLEDLKAEEEDYRDGIPENLQGSERYERADNACDSLYEVVFQLEEAIDNISAAVEV